MKDTNKTKEQLIRELTGLRQRIAEMEALVEGRAEGLKKANEKFQKEITSKVLAEKKLEEGEQIYRSVFENTGAATVIIEEDMTISMANSEFEKLSGYSKEQVEGKIKWTEFVVKEDLEKMKEYHDTRRQNGVQTPKEYEFRFVDKQGNIKHIFNTVGIIPGTGKSVASLTDITKRKRIGKALQKSEAQKKAILDASVDRIRLSDTDMRIIWANQTHTRDLNMAPEDLIGKVCYEVFVGRESPCPECPAQKVLKTGKIEHTLLSRCQEGEIEGKKYLDSYAVPIKNESGEIVNIMQVTRNITEQREAEEKLWESEERYRSLFDRLPLGVFQSTPDGRFLDANPAFTRLLGCPDLETLLSTPAITLYRDPEEREQWKRLTEKEGESFAMELEWQKLDGTPFWVRESARVVKDRLGRVLYYEGVAEDITERKWAEENQKNIEAHLQNAQRMEAIGTLAGGIAHDFNKILSAIMGYTEIALFHEPSGDSLNRQSLEQVLIAGERAKDLVKQILAFGRQAEKEHRPVLLQPLVKETLKLVRATLPSTIEIRQSIAPHTGSVMADPTQMHQVLMNLCTNAYHAMRKKGGVLKVNLEDVELDPDYTAKHLDLHPGPYIKLTVSDTGHGIKKMEVHRIFEPYFTTKEKGEGTGMGLAVVHGIVKDHGGSITVYSEPGKGTTFNVFLPRIKVAELEAKPEEITPLPMGRERILFVDDEPVLVDIGKRILERLGYKLEARTSPIEALEAFRTHPKKFDLVITDMTMPRMTGDELAKEFMAIRSDIPIILCTGFSERITEEKAKAIGIRAFAMKPFVMRDLANVVRRILDG